MRTIIPRGLGRNENRVSVAPRLKRIPYQIYTMDAPDGKNKRQLTTDGSNMQPVWLPRA